MARHREVVLAQTKSRDRVRDLAEVYTNKREVDAMLDLVPDMFPSAGQPRNIARTFLEPACGSGNFLVEILERKLAYVRRPTYATAAGIEAATLTALSSIYGIDIDLSNVAESRHFLRVEIEHHLNLALNTEPVSPRFFAAVDAILATNIIRADTLKDGREIVLVEYQWQRKSGHVIREWSTLEGADDEPDLFSVLADGPPRDAVPLHFSLLADNPEPVTVQPERPGAGS